MLHEPRTSRVVAMLGDARRRLRIQFLSDGVIDAGERQVLRETTAALIEARWADQSRKEAIQALNFGLNEPPSYHESRQRKDLRKLELALLDEPTPIFGTDPKRAA